MAAVSLMGLSIAMSCGVFAAETKTGATSSDVALHINAADIAGRWTGSHFSYSAARAKCDGKPCTMTVDVTPCGSEWCGVLVKEDGSCGAKAMSLKPSEGKDDWQRFLGKLELDPKAASYTIQATLWRSAEGAEKREIEIVGDTGPELRFMRRSFPFQAHLARTGDAVCTTEKATS